MNSLVEVGLSNAAAALVIAAVATLASLCRLRPAVVHALWLLVLIKLVTPPLVRIPVSLPASPLRDEFSTLSLPDEIETPAVEEDDPEIEVLVLPQLPEERIAAASAAPVADVVTAAPPAVLIPWQAWLGGFWAVGAMAWFGVAWVRVWRFGRLLRHGKAAPLPLLKRVRRLSKRVELGSPPEVRVLPGRLAPMIWGFGRPLLLLPESLEEQVGLDGLDTLLLHELSHLKRGDHLVRWLEFVALGLYWWLPVAWYARRELREAEEQCCDAWVVRTMPGARRLYATALVEALDFLSQPVSATPPLASALGQVADLKRRLTMIMRGTTPHLLGRPFGLAVFGLAFAVLPLVPGLGFAQSPPEEQEQQERRERREIRVDDADLKRLQEEMRRKKEEIEALARKMEQVAREKADGIKKKSKEMGEKIAKDVIIRLGDKKPGNALQIVISGPPLTKEETEELTRRIKEIIPGKDRKVTINSGPGAAIFWPKPSGQGGAHNFEFEWRQPKPPQQPSTPQPPRPADAAPKAHSPRAEGDRGPREGDRGPREGDRRLDSLERRLEQILKELESMKKEMRGPSRRGGGQGGEGGGGFGGFGGAFGRGRDEATKDAPKARARESAERQAK